VISNRRLADETPYSATAIGQVLSGKYAGDADAVLRALAHWLERRARRDEVTRPRVFIRTHVAEMIAAMIGQAHRRLKMAAIVSPAGSGKTLVIEAVRKRYNAVVVYADQQSMTPRELLREIADALGLKIKHPTTASLRREIIRAIKGHDRTIIIDEAQQLRPACAAVLRALYDLGATPVILLGSDRILELVDDRSSGGGQLSRRVLRCSIVDRLASEPWPPGSDKLGRPLFTAEEVRAWLAQRELKLTREGFELAVRIANLIDAGTFGLMADVVETAADLGEQPLNRNDLLTALTLLLGEAEYGRAARALRSMNGPLTATAAVA
jgi:DNA transposition AAA+ family ATPase